MKPEQQQGVDDMKAEIEAMGGSITTYEEVPPHIEEEFLRQALKRPERGQLHPMYPAVVKS